MKRAREEKRKENERGEERTSKTEEEEEEGERDGRSGGKAVVRERRLKSGRWLDDERRRGKVASSRETCWGRFFIPSRSDLQHGRCWTTALRLVEVEHVSRNGNGETSWPFTNYPS